MIQDSAEMAFGPASCTVDICIDMNHGEEPQGQPASQP